MKKAVIFDMDGVIILSETLYQARRDTFFKQYGETISEETNLKLIGSNPSDMFHLLYGDDPIKESVRKAAFMTFKKEYPMDYTHVLSPDITDVLVELKKREIKIGLASAGPLKNLHQILKLHQIDHYFDVISSGESFPKSKPHPAIYEHTVRKLGLTPNDCLAIEDSTHGIASATSAGLDVLAINPHGYSIDQSQATEKIKSLRDIIPWIDCSI